MARDPLLTLAQAALGRSLVTVLQDPPAGGLTLDELRADIKLVHELMAATYSDQPHTAAAHRLAASLLERRA